MDPLAGGPWSDGILVELAGGYANLTLAAVTWGALGFALAMLTKSAGAAIGIGLGWVLLVEALIGSFDDGVAPYLPGGTIEAVATGGTSELDWRVAVSLAVVYTAAALGGSAAAFVRRDVVE